MKKLKMNSKNILFEGSLKLDFFMIKDCFGEYISSPYVYETFVTAWPQVGLSIIDFDRDLKKFNINFSTTLTIQNLKGEKINSIDVFNGQWAEFKLLEEDILCRMKFFSAKIIDPDIVINLQNLQRPKEIPGKKGVLSCLVSSYSLSNGSKNKYKNHPRRQKTIIKWRNHFIPEVYLKKFSKNKKIFVGRIIYNNLEIKCPKGGVRDGIFMKPFLYSVNEFFSNEIEEFFAKNLEENFKDNFDKILNSKRNTDLDTTFLYNYIVFQRLRLPNHINMINNSYLSQIKKVEPSDVFNNLKKQLVSQSNVLKKEIIENSYLKIFIAPEGRSFLSNDNIPIPIKCSPLSTQITELCNQDFIFPIDTKYCLFVQKHKNDKSKKNTLQWFSVSSSDMNNLNVMIANKASRFFYGSKKELEIIKNLTV